MGHLAAQESDFSFDPKSKSVIPKFLGKVLLLKGEANATNDNGEDRGLKIGDKLFLDDVVKTNPYSYLKIEMVDSSLITLGPNSEMKFDKFDYRTKEDRESVYNLLKGQMRSQFLVKAKKDEAIKVKAGMISMGVRGTEFVVNSNKNANGETISEVLLLEGKIHLYDKATKKEWNMKPKDHYVSITGGDTQGIQSQMDDETFEKIKGPSLDPRRHFTPLLSFYELNRVVVKEPTRKKGRAPASVDTVAAEDYTPTRSWKSTLNELNNRLREND
ncbi:MAG: hypothetical protein OHK0056_26620 [Bacteriovoracaceae bacterium]